MKLVTYSFHEMKRVWVNSDARYVERPRGHSNIGLDAMFMNIITDFEMLPRAEFIKPYLLFKDEQSVQEALVYHKDSLLWLQCTMYQGYEAETFCGPTVQLTSEFDLSDLFYYIEENHRVVANNLPYIASVSIYLDIPTN